MESTLGLYLIVKEGQEPISTDWFLLESDYEEGMIVYDFINDRYTVNGVDWKKIIIK